MATRVTKSGGRHFPNGGALKRHVKPKGKKASTVLADTHRAIVERGTLFPHTVVHPSNAPRMLVDGINSRKIGKLVTKGRWAGMPIFTLTLEERATCPSTCLEWNSCYGNNMHWARRLMPGKALEERLALELSIKALEHPAGFVVRLHVLGDFYSVGYVRFWTLALARIPALRVFGFTARAPESKIGAAVLAMTTRADERCWIRFSGIDAGGLGAVVIPTAAESKRVVCPAQLDKTDCCGTCGLCWTMDRTIEFVRH